MIAIMKKNLIKNLKTEIELEKHAPICNLIFDEVCSLHTDRIRTKK